MAHQPNTLKPILCAHLLRKVDENLIALLSALALANGNCRRLRHFGRFAMWRRTCWIRAAQAFGERPCYVETTDIRSQQDVITLVNRLNREGVDGLRALSPRVLIEMMRLATKQSAEFHESLDPFATATFNVSWAGEEISLNWFDTARELTERWHHQQQIAWPPIDPAS